jgi:hypothetical protein
VSVDLISVSDVTVNLTLLKPFCGSFSSQQQQNVIGSFLYRVGGQIASLQDGSLTLSQVTSSSNLTFSPPYVVHNITILTVVRLSEIVCYGKGTSDYMCCDQLGYVNSAVSPCSAPVASAESKALLAISIIFAFMASLYPSV